MIWKNLKNNECPKCGESLYKDEEFYRCKGNLCEFKISDYEFESIINRLYRPHSKVDEERQNMDALNAL